MSYLVKEWASHLEKRWRTSYTPFSKAMGRESYTGWVAGLISLHLPEFVILYILYFEILRSKVLYKWKASFPEVIGFVICFILGRWHFHKRGYWEKCSAVSTWWLLCPGGQPGDLRHRWHLGDNHGSESGGVTARGPRASAGYWCLSEPHGC